MKTILSLTGLLVVLQLSEAQYYQWKRGPAHQFAIVNERKQTILMSNLEWKTQLPKRMIPSLSYHDFSKDQEQGQVAIKLFGPKRDVCVVTDAERPFQETTDELKRRSSEGKIGIPTLPKKVFKLRTLKVEELGKQSAELGKFCDGLDTYTLVPIDTSLPYPWWPWWWWWRTWCIWIEFPILTKELDDFKDISNGF